MRSKTDLKFFIASSLALKDQRQAVKDSVAALDAMGFPFAFSYYDYNEHTVQRYEEEGAQESVNLEWIPKCPFFVLIFDKQVKTNSLSEFNEAIRQFEKNRFPRNIFVFYNKAYEKEADEFIKRHASHLALSEDNGFVKRNNIFGYPYESAEEISDKIIGQVKVLMDNHDMPLVNAVHTSNIDPKDFYSDKTRRDHCKPGIYFKRKFDDDIYEKATTGTGNVVYVTGPSLSGKTRAVFKALRDIKDAWYIILGPDKIVPDKIEFLESVTEYIRYSRFRQKLYVILDDFDKFELEDRDLHDALNLFFKVLDKKNCTVIVTSSVHPDEFEWEKLGENTVYIKEMTDEECQDAELFFKRNGFDIGEDKRNFQYRMTGAMLVDLCRKRDEYDSFIRQRKRNARYISNLYRTLKAMSIWYDEEKGDFDNIHDFWKYLCRKDSLNTEGFDFRGLLEDMAKKLIGIKIIWNESFDIASLDIQEYVYKYFLRHDGTVISDSRPSSSEEERKLIEIIMTYVGEKFPTEILPHFSRIMNRCDFRKELVPWLFDVFETDLDKAEGWIRLLAEDRRRYELSASTEEMNFYYSRIFKQKIYSLDSFEESLEIYNSVNADKRDVFLFASLISSARTSEDFKRVTCHEDFKKNKGNFFVICRLAEVKRVDANGIKRPFVEFEDIFWLMTEAFEDGIFRQEEVLLREIVSGTSDELSYTQDFIRKAFSLLFSLVKEQSDIDRFSELLRKWYFVVTIDDDRAGEYRTCGNINLRESMKASLTLLELLQTVNIFHLRSGHVRLYESMGKEKIEEVGSHIKEQYIDTIAEAHGNGLPKHKIRQTIAAIANAALSVYKPEGKKTVGVNSDKYVRIKKNIFSILEYVFPQHTLILRDSFVYGSMLDLCPDVYKALDLFYNYIKPHLEDKTNPFLFNCLLLNRLLHKAYSTKDESKLLDVKFIVDSYDIEKDRYYYDSIIRSIPYKDSLEILEDRVGKEKLPFTMYTVPYLIENMASIPLALTLFSDIPEVDIDLPRRFDGSALLCNELASLPDNLRPENQQFAWISLFKKKCRDERERNALLACLEYIEEHKKNILLKDNRLYNCILSNKSIISNFDDAMDFVSRHSETFVPDTYTVSHLLDFIDAVSSENRIPAMQKVFKICVDTGFALTAENTSKRLRFYSSQKEKQPAFIINKDGSLNETKLTPILYLESLVDLGYEINSYHISHFMHIENHMASGIVARVLRIVNRYNIEISPELFNYIRWKHRGVVSLEQLEKFGRHLSEATADMYNIKLISAVEKGKKSVEEAMDEVDRSSVYSATKAYNAILSKLPKDYGFKNAFGLYQKYFSNSFSPNEQTFGILSQYVSCPQDIGVIINNLNQFNGVKVSPYVCVSHLKLTKSVEELKDAIGLYDRYHCEYNAIVYDHILLKVVAFADKGDEDAAARKLLKHVMTAMGVCDCGQGHDMDALMEALKLDVFRSRTNVSSRTLSNIFSMRDFGQDVDESTIVSKALGLYEDLFDEDVMKRLSGRCKDHQSFKSMLDVISGVSEDLGVKFMNVRIAKVRKNIHPPAMADFYFYVSLAGSEIFSTVSRRRLLLMLLSLAYKYRESDSYMSVSNGIVENIYNMQAVSLNDFGGSLTDGGCEEYEISPFELKEVDFSGVLLNKFNRACNADEKLMVLSEHLGVFSQEENETALTLICNNVRDESLLKQMADIAAFDSRLLNIVQNRLAELFWNYQGLYDLISLCVRNNQKTDPRLYSNIMLTICSRLHYDTRLTAVYNHIMALLQSEDNTLTVRDFLAEDDKNNPLLGGDIRLTFVVRERMKLAGAISASENLTQMSEMILDYCNDTDTLVGTLFNDHKGLIANHVIARCISLCRKTSMENIKKLFEYRGADVNVGFLFGKEFLDKAKAVRMSTKVHKTNLNYALLTQMDVEERYMIDCAFSNRIFESWINCVQSVPQAERFVAILKEKFPADSCRPYVTSTLKAAVKKCHSKTQFVCMLKLINGNVWCLKDMTCRHAVLTMAIKLLKADVKNFSKLGTVDLRQKVSLNIIGYLFGVTGLHDYIFGLTDTDKREIDELYEGGYMTILQLLNQEYKINSKYKIPGKTVAYFEDDFCKVLSDDQKKSSITFWRLQAMAGWWDKCTSYSPSPKVALAVLRRYMDFIGGEDTETRLARVIRHHIQEDLKYTIVNEYPIFRLHYRRLSKKVDQKSSRFVNCQIEDVENIMKEID